MKIILGILLGLIIILLNFRLIVFNDEFYLENSEAHKDYTYNLISFFKYEEELNPEFFNDREMFHLEDVKEIIKFTNYSLYILTAVFLLLMIKNYQNFYFIFIVSFIFILLLSILFYFLNFEYLFYKFHLISFNNYLWLLDPKTDNLINYFSEEFFYLSAKKIFLRSLFASFGLFLIGLSYFLCKNKFKDILAPI